MKEKEREPPWCYLDYVVSIWTTILWGLPELKIWYKLSWKISKGTWLLSLKTKHPMRSPWSPCCIMGLFPFQVGMKHGMPTLGTKT
jgi:hypothetical protein